MIMINNSISDLKKKCQVFGIVTIGTQTSQVLDNKYVNVRNFSCVVNYSFFSMGRLRLLGRSSIGFFFQNSSNRAAFTYLSEIFYVYFFFTCRDCYNISGCSWCSVSMSGDLLENPFCDSQETCPVQVCHSKSKYNCHLISNFRYIHFIVFVLRKHYESNL